HPRLPRGARGRRFRRRRGRVVGSPRHVGGPAGQCHRRQPPARGAGRVCAWARATTLTDPRRAEGEDRPPWCYSRDRRSGVTNSLGGTLTRTDARLLCAAPLPYIPYGVLRIQRPHALRLYHIECHDRNLSVRIVTRVFRLLQVSAFCPDGTADTCKAFCYVA